MFEFSSDACTCDVFSLASLVQMLEFVQMFEFSSDACT